MESVAGFASFSEIRKSGHVAWIHEDLGAVPLEEFWARPEPIPGAKGRGGVGRLTIAGRELVVRPYRRGGALGSLLSDRYSQPHRARQELEVLHRLQQEGVPVVVPVAALAKKGRAFWRLRLCTEWLADALPVPAFLARYPDRRRQTSESVGLVIRLAFAAGLRHPDLHLDNVLVSLRGDKVRAVLVDLDRARIKGPLSDQSRDGMLVRMQRHVVRHRRSLLAVPSRSETMRFLRGLGVAKGERAELWRRLAGKLERSMARRDWLRNR